VVSRWLRSAHTRNFLKQNFKQAEIMNLVYGEVVDIETEEGMKIGSVRVSGVLKKVPLHLIPAARRGDKVLLCDGVAIGKVEDTANEK
jgi:hydrogenase maturation factor